MTLQEKIQNKAEGFGQLAPVFLEGAKFVLDNLNEDEMPRNKICIKERWKLIDKMAAEQSTRRFSQYKESAENSSDLEVQKFFNNPFLISMMASCLEYGAKWADANPYVEWINYKEEKQTWGVEVIAYHHKWVDEDFNPNGTRIGFLSDDGFISAHWWDEQDCYETISKLHCDSNKDFYANHIDNTEPEFWCPIPKFIKE